MRSRVALVAAAAVFVAAVTGVAVMGGSGTDGGLPKLPLGATGREATADMMLGPVEDIEYRLGDLGKLPEEASAFRVPEADVEDRIVKLADAFGIDGEARSDRGGWVVEDGEKTLRVERAGGSPWSFSSESPDRAVSSSSVSCAMPECPPDMACTQVCPEPERPDGMLTPGQSVAVARRIMSAAGARLAGAVERVDDGGTALQVQFDPSVDGMPTTGFAHTVAVGPKGKIEFANGWMAEPKLVGRYPLVSAADALERLRTGFGIGPRTMDGREPAGGLVDAAPSGPAAEATKIVRTLTAVRVGLTFVPSYDSERAAHLVPAFMFKYEDSPAGNDAPDAELPVVAVTDEHIELIEPTLEYAPVPSDNDDRTGRRSSGACAGSAIASASASDADGGNQPMAISVCVEPSTAKVGQKVEFTVTATDPDAAVPEDQCFDGTEADFGDGTPQSHCIADCVAPEPNRTYRPETGELTKTYVHAYEAPGTYKVTFTYSSGSVCDRANPYASTGTASTVVTVVKR